MLAQCTALAHLDLYENDIGVVGGGSLRASWCGQTSVLLLEEYEDEDEDEDEEV